MTPQLFPTRKLQAQTIPMEENFTPKNKKLSVSTRSNHFQSPFPPGPKFQIFGLSKRSQRFGQGTRQSCLVEPTGKGIPWNLQSSCLMLIHFGLVIGNTFTNVFTCPKHQKVPEQRGAVFLYSKYEYVTLVDDRRSKPIPTNKAPRSGCFAIPTSSALLLLKGLPQWLSQG